MSIASSMGISTLRDFGEPINAIGGIQIPATADGGIAGMRLGKASSTSSGSGISLTAAAGMNNAFEVYSEVCAALPTAGTVARGIYSRMLVTSAQDTDSLYALVGHMRPVGANPSTGARASGVWAYFEMSGTATYSAGIHSALLARVETSDTLTFSAGAKLYGIQIDSVMGNITVSGTYDGLRITTDDDGAGSKKPWNNAISIGAAAVSASIMHFSAAISGIVSVSQSLNGSGGADILCDGFLKCLVDTTPYYIPLYDTIHT